MKPAPFVYVPARSVAEATDTLGEAEGPSVLAGGQSLVPLMNLRLAQPDVVVDINGIAELDTVEQVNGAARFGALCRQRRLEVDPDVQRLAPLVTEAVGHVGHVQIRNRGTFGGSLAHADPLSELPTVLVALGGHVEATSASGTRSIDAEDLYVGPFITTLEPGELLTAIELPVHTDGDGVAYAEFARRHGDFAVAGVAAAISLDDSGRCTRARLAGAGLGSTPVDLSSAASTIHGADQLSDEALTALADRVAEDVDPPTDIHASADYRRELAQLLAVQAVRSAWGNAEGVG